MEQVCRVLEVSRSGYYGWLERKPGVRSQKNQALRRRMIELHEKYPAMGRTGQPLPPAEAGVWLLPQARTPANAAGRSFLSTAAGL